MGKILGNATKPYARVQWRGVTVDQRTKSALKWAERRYLAVAPNKRKPWRFGQGSYNAGGVTASAGTHDGGGVVDIMFAGVPAKQRKATVKWLRRAGFAAWSRVGGAWSPGNEHAHAILPSRTNSSQAKAQVVAYRNGRDGLASNKPDREWRPKRPRRWSHRRNAPVLGK